MFRKLTINKKGEKMRKFTGYIDFTIVITAITLVMIVIGSI